MIIINLFKPSQVLIARYLPITIFNTIKVSYDVLCKICVVCWEVVKVDCALYWFGRG